MYDNAVHRCGTQSGKHQSIGANRINLELGIHLFIAIVVTLIYWNGRQPLLQGCRRHTAEVRLGKIRSLNVFNTSLVERVVLQVDEGRARLATSRFICDVCVH